MCALHNFVICNCNRYGIHTWINKAEIKGLHFDAFTFYSCNVSLLYSYNFYGILFFFNEQPEIPRWVFNFLHFLDGSVDKLMSRRRPCWWRDEEDYNNMGLAKGLLPYAKSHFKDQSSTQFLKEVRFSNSMSQNYRQGIISFSNGFDRSQKERLIRPDNVTVCLTSSIRLHRIIKLTISNLFFVLILFRTVQFCIPNMLWEFKVSIHHC